MIVPPPWLGWPETRLTKCRPQQPGVIDAVMLEEAIVLGSQKCLLDAQRYVFVRDRYASVFADLRDQAPIATEDPERHLQPHIAQRPDIGNRRGQEHIAAECRVTNGCGRQQNSGKNGIGNAQVTLIHRKGL